jgi:para-nitrobenzyl esterase
MMSGAPIVETACGKVRGSVQAGVCAFKGIPYGAGTGGIYRFRPPRSLSWAGIKDASAFGCRSPQDEDLYTQPHRAWLRDAAPADEDCLALNVFTHTLDHDARQPVMVYLHGGGFMMGGAGAPGLDGSNLARRGTVVVTVNHRLNLFGFLHLADARDGRFTESGNVGMLDVVAALEWVRLNIERFGGDPGNVTVFGQSGGGSKVAILMAMPRARGLFHKAIIQSASSLLRLSTLEEAERNTDFFLRALDLDRSKLASLQELAPETLLQARLRAVVAAGRIDNYRPVVDGVVVASQPFDAWRSGHVPLLTGWCANEQRLAFAESPSVLSMGERPALEATAAALAVNEADAARLFDVYRQGRPDDTPGDLYTQIFGDHRYRRNVTRAAELEVARGARVYMYQLAWRTPVLKGSLRTPHTLCIPFVFANSAIASGMTGAGSDRYQLQEQMAQAWISFARSGNPNHSQLPAWAPYSLATRPTMVFDRESRVVLDPLREERVAFESFPRYVPAVGEGGRSW